jgi:hypothetical protein
MRAFLEIRQMVYIRDELEKTPLLMSKKNFLMPILLEA